MVRRRWPDAVLAGNLRVSALDLLPQITPDTRVVLELSSWQLEGLDAMAWSPHLAAVTNLSPDHLNRYRDMADYAEAKRIIVKYQRPERGDMAVLNADDPVVSGFAQARRGRWSGSGCTGQARPPAAYLDGETLTWRPADGDPVSLVQRRRSACAGPAQPGERALRRRPGAVGGGGGGGCAACPGGFLGRARPPGAGGGDRWGALYQRYHGDDARRNGGRTRIARRPAGLDRGRRRQAVGFYRLGAGSRGASRKPSSCWRAAPPTIWPPSWPRPGSQSWVATTISRRRWLRPAPPPRQATRFCSRPAVPRSGCSATSSTGASSSAHCARDA